MQYRRVIFAVIHGYSRDPDEVMDLFSWVCEALRRDDLRRLRKYGVGETASDSTCTAIPEPPLLGSNTIDRDTVELVWNDASAFEDGYQVWDASVCGCRWDATLIAELPANTTSYRIALPAGQYGYYFIQPVKGGGQGQNSMIEEITNTTPP